MPEYVIKLLQITALPKALRPSRAQICQALDICEGSYYKWLRDDRFNRARRDFIKQYFYDDVPDVLLAMKHESIAGNVMAAKLFLEFVDEFTTQEEKKANKAMPISEVNIIINNLEQKFYGTKTDETIIDIDSE